MTQGVSENVRMETGGRSSELLNGSQEVLRRLGRIILRPLKKVDQWVSARVDAPPQGESGWYLHTGEGRAIAAGAEATEGVDISAALRGPDFDLAIEAVRQTEVPQNSDYGALLDATFNKYHELRKDAATPGSKSHDDQRPTNGTSKPSK